MSRTQTGAWLRIPNRQSHNGCPSSGYLMRLHLQDIADVRMHGGEGATGEHASCFLHLVQCRPWLPSA